MDTNDDTWTVLSNAVHELRSPIANVLGFTELLLSAEETGASHDILLRICRNTNRLRNVVENISEVARTRATDAPDPREVVLLQIPVATALERLRDDSALKAIEILRTFDQRAAVRGNEDDLARLFENIIGNAIKYSEAHKTIWVNVFWTDQHAGVEVIDQGTGIAEEDLSSIFMPFYRTESARLSGSIGSGLGLLISKQIADRHDGTIDVKSTVGKGTVVTISIPGYDREELPSCDCVYIDDCRRADVADCTHPTVHGVAPIGSASTNASSADLNS